jgi:hypothetical protein
MPDINPLNYIKGEAYVWAATTGTTEPAQTNAALIQDPGAGWTFIGATQGGVSWEDDEDVSDTVADQVIDPIGGRVVGRKTTITFACLEATVANFALALNNFGVVTVGDGITIYEPGQQTAGSIPQYSAFLVDGWAPQLSGGGAARRRAIFRKVLNKVKVTEKYDPTKDDLIDIAAGCYFVSSTIRPWVKMDQTA